MLPKTIDWTFTAVPRRPVMLYNCLYFMALGVFQDWKTAFIVISNWVSGSVGKSPPVSFLYSALYFSTSSWRCFVASPVSPFPLTFFFSRRYIAGLFYDRRDGPPLP